MAFKFEELQVWQKSIEFTLSIHKLTRNFPDEERFILTSQIKRATDSIALNIAEGSTGQSDAEFSRFLGIAIRSAIEVVTCLYIGKKRGLIDQTKFDELYMEVQTMIRMTQALRNFIKKNHEKK
ncbi:MAG: four helix bundle protein [Microscillaceae bacterium]|nr:four helix bundle protein [Microscillaceae bacterium]